MALWHCGTHSTVLCDTAHTTNHLNTDPSPLFVGHPMRCPATHLHHLHDLIPLNAVHVDVGIVANQVDLLVLRHPTVFV